MTGWVRVCVRVSVYKHRLLCAGVRVIEFDFTCACVCARVRVCVRVGVCVCVCVCVRESVNVWLPECAKAERKR